PGFGRGPQSPGRFSFFRRDRQSGFREGIPLMEDAALSGRFRAGLDSRSAARARHDSGGGGDQAGGPGSGGNAAGRDRGLVAAGRGDGGRTGVDYHARRKTLVDPVPAAGWEYRRSGAGVVTSGLSGRLPGSGYGGTEGRNPEVPYARRSSDQGRRGA